MAELELVNNKRKAMRGQCATLCEGIQKDCVKEKVTAEEWRSIEARLECLSVREQDLSTLNGQFLDNVTLDFYQGSEYEKELKQVDEYHSLIKETKLCAAEKNPHRGHVNQYGTIKEPTVRLPVLELPVFEGDITAFMPFFESFKETIGDNPNISTLDKFKYLKSFIKGEAAKVIQSIPVKSDNYKLAMDTLETNFGQTETITHAHLTALNELKPVQDVHKVKQLRELLNTLEMHVRAIQNLGVKPNEYNLLLFHKVSNLLPQEMVLGYCQREMPAEVDALLTWLHKEVANRGRCQLLVHRSDGLKTQVIKQIKTAATLHLGQEEQEEEDVGMMAAGVAESTSKMVNAKKREVRPFCVLCYEYAHWTDNCDVERTWEEKKTILSKRGRCFRCASRDHLSRECQNPRASCQKCQGKHLTTLCPGPRSENVSVSSMAVQAQQQSSTNLLQTAHAIASVKAKHCDVRILLDGGSQCSFVKEDVVNKLKLASVESVKVKLNTFGGGSATKRCRVVMIPLHTREQKAVCVVRALVVPTLSVQRLAYCSDEVQRICRDKHMELADRPIWPGARETDDIDMLIGVDFYWKIVEPKVQRVGENLVAMLTKLGWVVQGVQPTLIMEPRMDDIAVDFLGYSEVEEDDIKYDHLWRFDAIGVHEPQKTEEVEQVEIEWVNDQYQVTLPWKTDRKHRLSNNLSVAQQRLHNLIRQLERQPGLLDIYHEAMGEYLRNGHAEFTESASVSEPGYYLPHRAVFRQDTTTNVRVVFDASSKVPRELSLNDCISAGADRQLDMIGILLRFRRFPWAMAADIKKAFLQIKIHQSDWKYLKFLWLDLEKAACKPYNVKEYCMTTVTFGVNASPYLLRLVIQSHLSKYVESCGDIIGQCGEDMYVDDLVESVNTKKSLKETQQVLNSVFQEGGFVLRKWISNDAELMRQWKAEGVEVEEKRSVKILGQLWKVDDDELWALIPVEKLLVAQTITKRVILKLVASFFDPLGVLSLMTIKAKMLLQKVWTAGTGWDETVPEEICHEWNQWKQEVLRCEPIRIKRWCGYREEVGGELHGFCDASEQAFGVILYWRTSSYDGEDDVGFQLAKYRVTPLNEENKIPRIELMGAVLMARMVDSWIKDTHIQPNKTCLWTDSEIVLYWIQRTDRLRDVFVQRRLDEIRRLTCIDDWRHCPGELNPADQGTRKQDVVIDETVNKWLKGPKWLQHEEKWPPRRMFEAPPEILIEGAYVIQVEEPTYLIEAERFSSWSRLIRVTGWCLRFVNRCRKKNIIEQLDLQLTSEELQQAFSCWMRAIQRKWYEDEIRSVTEQRTVPRTSTLRKFRLFLDQSGVLRLYSRLNESLRHHEVASPIILPGKDPVVHLYLRFRHECLLHEGCNALLADSRRRFWIIKGRQACKRVIAQCVKCRRVNGPHFEPRTGPLPVERVMSRVAFENVGMDFAGPIYIKGNEKTYMLIITCLFSRAVHIELVSNLTAERFMLALQRFVARRGQPHVVYSDNALTYKKASRILKQILSTNVAFPKYSFFKLDPLSWKFIPERSPWMGGIWERVVRSVKGVLRKILGEAGLTFEELSTVLTVVESVLNSRPLTAVSDDSNDEMPLTPNHLVSARPLCSFPLYDLGRKVPELCLMKRYRYLQTVLQSFNRRWYQEYLLILRNNHVSSQGSVFLPKVGDVVLIEIDNVKHHLYPMGRIVSLNFGRDKVARSAQIRLCDGKLMCRPVKRLYPLEPCPTLGGSVEKD